MVVVAAVVATEEGAMEVVAAMVAIVAKVIKIIKVGSTTDFQCCGKNLSAVVTF